MSLCALSAIRARRYIASLDFSFRPDSVRYVLQREGIPFVEEQAPELILIPVVRNAKGAIETGRASRVWTDIWKGSRPREHADANRPAKSEVAHKSRHAQYAC